MVVILRGVRRIPRGLDLQLLATTAPLVHITSLAASTHGKSVPFCPLFPSGPGLVQDEAGERSLQGLVSKPGQPSGRQVELSLPGTGGRTHEHVGSSPGSFSTSHVALGKSPPSWSHVIEILGTC